MQMAPTQQSKAYLKARDRLAQNSALLASINDAPVRPQEFHLAAGQGQYQLPVERERQLSEDFAFLAARKKDPTKVVAVAIEEDQDKQGMTIRVAVNQGDLSVVQDGLTRMAQVMQRASTLIDTRESLQPQLLQDIIVLDLPKILSRLRSKHAPSNGNRPLGEPIIHLLRLHVDGGIAALPGAKKIVHKDLQKQCKLLTNVFDRFEALKSAQVEVEAARKIVSEILQRIVQLVSRFDIQAVLRTSRNIDPSLLESLPISLSKLARYHRLSSDLINAARDSNYTVFRTIRVRCLNANDFVKTSVTLRSHPLSEVLNRFQTINMNLEVVKRARSKLWMLTGETNHVWKIHAEIQLLSFYQFQKIANVPCILAASKSSCYLCCQFIRAHGRFQVPRTHGKLYSQWTPPDIPNGIKDEPFLKIINQLNQQLETEIRKALVGPVRRIVYPSESVNALNLPWSPASTVAVLTTVNESMAMSPASASLSLPDTGRSLTSDAQFERCSRNLETNKNQERSNLSHVLLIPEANETLNKEANISSLTASSLSIDDGVCLDITSNWSCHRMYSLSQGVWYHNNGLDLYLSLIDNNNPARDSGTMKNSLTDHKYWIGVKNINLNSEIQSDELENGFDVAHLDLNEHVCDADATVSNKPLVLKWLGSALILKFSIDRPPIDPIPVT